MDKQFSPATYALLRGSIDDWLSEHVDPETGYVLDDSLTLENAAAQAKAVGDALASVAADKADKSDVATSEAELDRRILASFPTDTVEAAVAEVPDGADGIPVKALSASISASYALAPNVYIPAASPYAVAKYEDERQRCIAFPCAASTQYEVTSGITATMRIASFPAFPEVGDEPTQFATAVSNSVSLTTGASDKWVLVQFFINDNASATLAAALGAGFGISPAPVWSTVPVHRAGKNLCDSATLFAGVWDSTVNNAPQSTENATRKHTPLFRINGGETYSWSVAVAFTTSIYCVWYDDKLSEIRRDYLYKNTTSVALTAPASAKYVSLSVYNPDGQTVQFERAATESTSYEAYSGQTVTLTLADGTTDEPLTTKLGSNDIYADAGTVSVTYRADPTLYIDKKLAALGG